MSQMNTYPNRTSLSPTPVSTGESAGLLKIAADVLMLIALEIFGTLGLGLLVASVWGGSLLNVLCSAVIASIFAYTLIAQQGRQSHSARGKRLLLDTVITGLIFSGAALCLQIPLREASWILLVNLLAGPLGLLISLALAPQRPVKPSAEAGAALCAAPFPF